jgi:hypothetical protein
MNVKKIAATAAQPTSHRRYNGVNFTHFAGRLFADPASIQSQCEFDPTSIRPNPT